jgi:hypothetical protein
MKHDISFTNNVLQSIYQKVCSLEFNTYTESINWVSYCYIETFCLFFVFLFFLFFAFEFAEQQ